MSTEMRLAWLESQFEQLRARVHELERHPAVSIPPVYMPTPAFPQPERPYIGDPMPPPSIT